MARGRRKGSGGNPGGKKGKNPAQSNGKGTPARRNTPTTGANPRARESAAERAERLRNTGVVPRKSRAERRLFEGTRTPRNIQSAPNYTPTEVRAAIDAASANLSPATVAALRRAEWFNNTEGLLTERPTPSSWPMPSPKNDNKPWKGPRTMAAGYDYQSGTLFVRFRGKETSPGRFDDGVGYEYYNVSASEWQSFINNWSPGRYIDDVLNNKPYTPATW